MIPRAGSTPEPLLIPSVETVIQVQDTANLWFEGLEVMITDWVDEVLSVWHYADARGGIFVNNSKNVAIIECKVHNTGADGIRFEEDGGSEVLTDNCFVGGCLLEKTGVMGLAFWSHKRCNESHCDEPSDPILGHTIIHNKVRRCGEAFPWGGGALFNSIRNTLVGNNDISETTRYGVYFRRSYSTGNRIERNDIWDVIRSSGDVGGITIWHGGGDNLIYNNLVHDVTTRLDHLSKNIGPQGIYVDDQSHDTTVAANAVYGITTSPASPTVGTANLILRGTENLIQNNIFVTTGTNGVRDHVWTDAAECNEMKKNIFFDDGWSFDPSRPALFHHRGPATLGPDLACASNPAFDCDRGGFFTRQARFTVLNKNLYWHGLDAGTCTNSERCDACTSCLGCDVDAMHTIQFSNPACERSYCEWKTEFGYDADSLYADPLFEDLQAGDLSLQPGSPAYALGFQDIDFDDVGAHLNLFQ